MTKRERVMAALHGQPVDRVPLLYRMKHEAKEKLARVYGIEDAATGRKHNPALELRLGMAGLLLVGAGWLFNQLGSGAAP